ncbi:MFS transporter [Microbacterium foliorum]|uniref:MFS transporter n=1 Tax=Microbacterium foliorum TaxID=104336 RepID=UPI001D48C617|nr:MFS transporter [Microbacterium foliorum]CAH0161896.1 putative multidrug-efflux transporter Rv1258c [Microbacterium foliorum]CAH0186435.1 putative multidrug-efflux transporter Rv1258c [Microbacterium foliorum]
MGRNSLVYLLSYCLSLLGNGIATVVFPLLVLARTGDLLAAGLVAAVAAGVSAVVGLFAGVLIDRMNRRTVSIVSDLLSAASIAALPIVDAIWGLNMTWFVALAAVGAFGDTPGMTARETLLPGVVRLSGGQSGSLDRIVGVRESLAAVLMLAGPGIGGLLVWLFGVGASVLWVTAGMSALAAVVSLGIDRRAGAVEGILESDPSSAQRKARGVLADLVGGWRFMVGNRLVLTATIVSAFLVATMVALQTTLLPAYFLAEDLPGLAGLVLAGLSLGSLIGAAAYAATVGKVTRRTWFVSGMLGIIASFAVLGTMPAVWAVLAAAVLLGLANTPAAAVLGVATIEATPDNLRGRVLGTQNAVIMAGPAIGTVPIAAVASAWGLQAAGVSLAVVVALVAVLALLSPALRSLSSPAAPDNTSAKESDHDVEH